MLGSHLLDTRAEFIERGRWFYFRCRRTTTCGEGDAEQQLPKHDGFLMGPVQYTLLTVRMDNILSTVDVRVIGSLIEKEITTPDNYPLTLNALIAACNQTSNRDPVMTLDEPTVSKSLDELSRRSLVRAVHRSDSRVKRYRQAMSESMNLHPAETAVMCVLMLRGAQTTGEIRTRTARMFEFRDLQHVEITLQVLMTLPIPL